MESAETASSSHDASLSRLLLVFLAVSFPPSVAMLRGTPRQITISTLLTLLIWIPGVIFALWLLAAPSTALGSQAVAQPTKA